MTDECSIRPGDTVKLTSRVEKIGVVEKVDAGGFRFVDGSYIPFTDGEKIKRTVEIVQPELPTELWSIIEWYGEQWVLAPDLYDLRDDHRGASAWIRASGLKDWFTHQDVKRDSQPFRVVRVGLGDLG